MNGLGYGIISQQGECCILLKGKTHLAGIKFYFVYKIISRQQVKERLYKENPTSG